MHGGCPLQTKIETIQVQVEWWPYFSLILFFSPNFLMVHFLLLLQCCFAVAHCSRRHAQALLNDCYDRDLFILWHPLNACHYLLTGVIIGTGMVDLEYAAKVSLAFREHGYSKMTPHFIPKSILNMPSGHVSMKYQLRVFLSSPFFSPFEFPCWFFLKEFSISFSLHIILAHGFRNEKKNSSSPYVRSELEVDDF